MCLLIIQSQFDGPEQADRPLIHTVAIPYTKPLQAFALSLALVQNCYRFTAPTALFVVRFTYHLENTLLQSLELPSPRSVSKVELDTVRWPCDNSTTSNESDPVFRSFILCRDKRAAIVGDSRPILVAMHLCGKIPLLGALGTLLLGGHGVNALTLDIANTGMLPTILFRIGRIRKLITPWSL